MKAEDGLRFAVPSCLGVLAAPQPSPTGPWTTANTGKGVGRNGEPEGRESREEERAGRKREPGGRECGEE